MNILFYTPFNLRSRDTESLMQEFVKQHHSVFLLTQAKKGIYHQKCESYGVTTFANEVKTSSNILFVIKHWIHLIKFSRKYNIQVIYAHLENASMIAVLAQYFIKAKVISCRHVTEEPHYYKSKKYIFQIKLVNNLSKKIIVVSNRCKQFMIDIENVKSSKIEVINLSYNFNLYEPIDEAKVHEIKKNNSFKLRFVMASRFIENKKPIVALQLLKKLKEQGISASLIILGVGPLKSEIKNYIIENDLDKEVKLIGYVDNVLDYFSASDILLIPSITESSSVVLKEAGLANITAIICKGVGDGEDFLQNKSELFIVNKETFVEEAVMISKEYQDNDKVLKMMGKRLNLKIIERFAIEKNISSYLQFNKINKNIRLAFVSSHIHKSLQFEWFHEELQKQLIYNIHIIINTMRVTEPLLASELRNLGIKCYVLNYKNNLSFIKLFFRIRKILKQNKVNVVHTTLPYGNLIGQLAAISLLIKARVTTCENASWAFDYKSKNQWLIDKITFWSSKKIISVANTANDFLLNNWKINEKKIVQINHSLKFDAYENVSLDRIKDLEQLLNIIPSDFTIGMISRTEFWKGHPYVIEAMVNISKKYPNIKLQICGSVGFDHQKLLGLIAEYKLENNVKFFGFINDSIAFLKVIKIQVHVPINKYVENCGISIIEGMASKTPQLLTLSGYAFQSAKHLKNAYVVDYCNAKEIAQGIEYLYLNYQDALKFGEQAYSDSKEQYTIDVKYEKHLAIYQSLLN